MTELASQGHYKSAKKLGEALQILHPGRELRDQIELFRQLELRRERIETEMPGSMRRADARIFSSQRGVPITAEIGRRVRRSQLRHAPAVLMLILLNAVIFFFEIAVGDLNDPEVLHRLGALEPYAVVVQGEYWRLFSALFLHGGFTHLLFNVFALYILGPPLERSIGTPRFVACYLTSGLASGVGVLALTVIGLVYPAQLVGASGCIMGIVGAWAGFLLRHRHALYAKQRLGNVVMIIAIQIAFDLSTPQVSMSAHLCGLVAGFFLGLVLAPRSVAGVADPSES